MDNMHDRVVGEIDAVLDDLASRGEQWVAKWVTHSVCSNHSLPLDDDNAAFWRWSGYLHVRDLVRRRINERAGDKPGEASGHQIVLDGFESDHMQTYYVVERDDERVGIPVMDMTDEEIEEKARRYEGMGDGCYAHADELRRFKTWRRTAA